MFCIRRADIADAENIHKAHMRSIQEVCAKDYSAEEIKAWGQREFNPIHRINNIENDYVWVVSSDDGEIYGYGHFKINKSADGISGYVHGLYFCPECIGLGLGKELMQEIFLIAKKSGLKEIQLDATLTSFKFYQKMGFKISAPERKIMINDVGVRSVPMSFCSF